MSLAGGGNAISLGTDSITTSNAGASAAAFSRIGIIWLIIVQIIAAGMGGYLAKMMENPEMKKMIREQQKAALKMIYGDLYKDLNMTEDEKAKFTEALLDNQMKNMERGTKLFQQDPEGADKEAAQKVFRAAMSTIGVSGKRATAPVLSKLRIVRVVSNTNSTPRFCASVRVV